MFKTLIFFTSGLTVLVRSDDNKLGDRVVGSFEGADNNEVKMDDGCSWSAECVPPWLFGSESVIGDEIGVRSISLGDRESKLSMPGAAVGAPVHQPDPALGPTTETNTAASYKLGLTGSCGDNSLTKV